MQSLDYPALAALAAVAREGSFDRAAQVLGVTPSAISQRVKALEERLGGVLILRGQPCVASDLGRALCAHWDRVRLLEADLAPLLSAAPVAPAIRLAVNADSLATWFAGAVARFVGQTGGMIDVTLDDETHTAGWLRSGEVLGAITADADPVPGCRNHALGAMRYRACASPNFVARHLADGVDADGLSRAPHLRFDRKDRLQARWAGQVFGLDLQAPTLWIPSTQGFLDCTLSGLAWGMQPEALVRPHLLSGALVELVVDQPLDVPLYWNVVRLHAGSLKALSDAILAAARDALVV